jgi:methionyl-tRNA formyltransferase
MRIGWVGFHIEGLLALRRVLEQGFSIEAVLTLKPDLAAKRSGAGDYSRLCQEFSIPLYEIANINDEESLSLLKKLSLDVVFVIGWTQIVRPEALTLVRFGMIGAHASLLPHNRGRAPINWAIIKGEKQTGNSLMWLAQGVDTGDIIDQVVIPITPYDTCASLYEKVAESNRDMIVRLIPRLLANERPGLAQSHNGEANLPGRQPKDGLLNWGMKNAEVYDFVRALTKPYPGAFSWLDGKRWTIWQCAFLPGSIPFDAKPGEITGAVVSPVEAACGQAVACGAGAVVLLELEDDRGEILKGIELSDRDWRGRVWTNEQYHIGGRCASR